MAWTRIAVTGVSGAGKSAVGEALAARLGWAYRDGDDLHSPAAVRKMASGVPLDDADRLPWLDRVGDWLAGVDRGVVACSALTASYRSRIRTRAPDAWFVQLTGAPELLAARLGDRRGHFMPASLLPTQLALLEPLGPAEAGVVLDAAPPVAELVDRIVAVLSTPE